MKITENIGNLTINAELFPTDLNHEEFVGDFYAEIPSESVKLFLSHYEDADIRETVEMAGDDAQTVQFSNADALIKLLRGLSELSPNTLDFQYFGNPYWFFHDLQHVKRDCEIVEKTISLKVNDIRESSALLDGAFAAYKAKVALSLIVRALVKAEAEFHTRWKDNDFDILGNFLDNLVTT